MSKKDASASSNQVDLSGGVDRNANGLPPAKLPRTTPGTALGDDPAANFEAKLLASVPMLTTAIVPALLKEIAPLISEGIAEQIEYQLRPVKQHMEESDSKHQITQDLLKSLNSKFDKLQCSDAPLASPRSAEPGVASGSAWAAGPPSFQGAPPMASPQPARMVQHQPRPPHRRCGMRVDLHLGPVRPQPGAADDAAVRARRCQTEVQGG